MRSLSRTMTRVYPHSFSLAAKRRSQVSKISEFSLNAEQSITPNHIAGADIKEMQSKSFAEVYSTDFLANWAAIRSLRKPVIAA